MLKQNPESNKQSHIFPVFTQFPQHHLVTQAPQQKSIYNLEQTPIIQQKLHTEPQYNQTRKKNP